MKILVTGSQGLVGSEAVRFFLDKGNRVVGIDNNMREDFFGKEGSVKGNIITNKNYSFIDMDIRNAQDMIYSYCPDVVIHCAAQPSHDWAARNPALDFDINAFGTLKLLEACRQYCPDVIFIYVSTNKVYGDKPHKKLVEEYPTRYEIPNYEIDESTSIDYSMHSLFGVSKLSGDLLAQEYGRYFGMKTGIFRCGCITGSHHAGVELHGFLSYLVKCKKENKLYRIFGYKGKQVRDNIHAFDLVNAFYHFIQNPRPGEVYNMGGGRHSNVSIIEAMTLIEKIAGGRINYEYIDQPRKGDHIWYISDVRKFKGHYPKWEYTYNIEKIIEDIISA